MTGLAVDKRAQSTLYGFVMVPGLLSRLAPKSIILKT
jgi:hypothetical protein